MNARDQATQAAQARTDADWLAAHWMPYTPNREFKAAPRLFAGGSGRYYTTSDGRKVFDGLSGLWCTGLGHGRQEIADAIGRQAATLDYSPAFQFAHPLSFELANRIVERMPAGLNRVFFTDSGSEAADTSLKMARAYWRLRGKASKTRFVGRIKGYHGVNYGGMSVGGIVGNRTMFGQGIETDHLPHTQPPAGSYFRGMPETGANLADELLSVIGLHGADTIAAVIVEPFSGSAGVVIPPKGYLEKLRAICTAHDILLIFDEVITGFGRTGAWTGSEAFGVTPDMINFAKQITNGVQPLGGVVTRQDIYDTFMAVGTPDYQIEFPHGYTYSAHPVACAAALASLDLLDRDGAIEQVRAIAPKFEAAVHGLKGVRHVTDIRNFGLAAGITIAALPGEPAKRPWQIGLAMFRKGFYVRFGGDTVQLAPPFSTTEAEIDSLVSALAETLTATE
jgi:beta-alanine--pyruvate transaminase